MWKIGREVSQGETLGASPRVTKQRHLSIEKERERVVAQYSRRRLSCLLFPILLFLPSLFSSSSFPLSGELPLPFQKFVSRGYIYAGYAKLCFAQLININGST